jgi:hypothetical protein
MSGTTHDGPDAVAPGRTPPDAPLRKRGRRKQPVHLSAPAWKAARLLYEDGAADFDAIAEKVGVTRATVIRRAKTEGWVRQGDLRDLIDSGDARGLTRMVARLTAAFEAQIRAVELQFRKVREGAENMTEIADAASVERNARTLGSLAKTLDILIELRSGLSGLEPQERDEDALRRELAQRLDRLRRSGPAAGVPGGTRPG